MYLFYPKKVKYVMKSMFFKIPFIIWRIIMKKQTGNVNLIIVGVIAAIFFVMFISSYNGHVTRDEQVKSSWSEVVNQYQRRADLIPNLVAVVQGYASHEKETLTAVINARASATSFKITPEVLNNPKALAKFQEVQGGLAQALSKLMMVSERYPELKANENFRDLQAQLEGTENRVTVARNRFITETQAFNTAVRTFPGNMTAGFGGFSVKPSFQVENEQAISSAPKVNFNPTTTVPVK